MKDKNLQELYKTSEGRYEILKEIFKIDNFSITQIVAVKESAMNDKISENNTLINGLAFRATAMFTDKVQDMIKNIEQVKPLVAQDILKSGVIKGTKFEEQLLKNYH